MKKIFLACIILTSICINATEVAKDIATLNMNAKKAFDMRNYAKLSITKDENKAVFVADGLCILISNQSFKVKPNTKYQVSVKAKSLNTTPTFMLLGLAPFDAKGRLLGHINFDGVQATLTELSRSCNAKDKVIYVKDASKWQGTNRSIAFDAKADKSDIPNFNVSNSQVIKVEEVEEEGSMEESEVDLLRSAIEFTERRAEDILTHRRHIEAVDVTATKEEIAEKFEETKYSRLLVYNDTIDNVVGVIHQKGFYDANGITKIPMHELMGSVVFVQKSEKISDVLKQLQQGKTHIAVVIDEYGGTFGMITMEDILEELVGEIWDEHDEVVEHFTVNEDGTVRVDATINMDEFCRYFDVRIDTECALVGAYVQEELDKLPEIGDTFDVAHLTITVSELDVHHMTMVDVTVHERAQEEE